MMLLMIFLYCETDFGIVIQSGIPSNRLVHSSGLIGERSAVPRGENLMILNDG